MHSPKNTPAVLLIALGILLGALLSSATIAQEAEERPRNRFDHDILKETFGYDESTPATVEFEEMFQGCPERDCIPSIEDPEYVEADEASAFLGDDELVIAVDHNGDKRAWPIRVLDFHEIVNDTIGGDPIAVTWCPLCGSGLAFMRKVEGETVEFGVSGLLHDSDLVMYDRKTNSLWQQITGEAVMGPAMGQTLEEVPATITAWKNWRSAHPETRVMAPPSDSDMDYGDSRRYAAYEESDRLAFPAARRDLSIHPKTVVHGFTIDGMHLAVTESALEENANIETELGNRSITISRHDDGRVTAVDDHGRSHSAVRSFWFAWFNFHPDTERI
ncbi:MAG: DUF3179 domain-containing protein [Wenzhouxiangellaceae bacterium]